MKKENLMNKENIRNVFFITGIVNIKENCKNKKFLLEFNKLLDKYKLNVRIK